MQSNGNRPPSPPHSTSKTYYQSRMGVSPTKTTQIGFDNSAENGERQMYHGREMGYTPINSREPTPMEKGVPTKQSVKGGYNNAK